MHTNDTVNLDAGYEWWIMTEAKRRNSAIKLYGLPWAFPGWVGNDPHTGIPNTTTPYNHPEQTVRYMLEWVTGAKAEHSLDIDYLGVWNESPSDATFVKHTHARTLHTRTHARTRTHSLAYTLANVFNLIFADFLTRLLLHMS